MVLNKNDVVKNINENKGVNKSLIDQFASSIKVMDTFNSIVFDRKWTSTVNFELKPHFSKIVVVKKYKNLVDVIDFSDFEKIKFVNNIFDNRPVKNIGDIKKIFNVNYIEDIYYLNGVDNIIRTMSWVDVFFGYLSNNSDDIMSLEEAA